MPYSTLTDLKKLLPEDLLIQLTDDEGAGVVNQGRIDEAIAQADAEIDSYCGVKYTVPFVSPIPDLVKKVSVDISIYNLYSRRVEEIPGTRADRYKNAIRQLEGIAGGKISIGEATEPTAATNADGAVTSKTDDDRIFTRDNMSGF
jgi:phage gp36-like protein